MGYNGWPIPLRLQGIMVVLFSKNKYPVQDNDSLQVNLIEKNCPSEGSTKNCSGKSP